MVVATVVGAVLWVKNILPSCHHITLYLASSGNPLLLSWRCSHHPLAIKAVWTIWIQISILPIMTKRQMLDVRSTQ